MAGAPPVRPTFQAVYAECFDMVWRLAAHRVPASALDDVVQEVFLVVHRKLPDFEGRSSVRTWVYGIVRWVVRDYVRNHGNRPLGAPLEEEPVSENEFLISVWQGTMHFVKADGTHELLLDTRAEKTNAADIGYDRANRIVYVPTFFKNTVVAYELKTAKSE